MRAVGIHDAGDFNSGRIMGSQYFALTTTPETQERASAANTYLKKFADLPNLTVYTETVAKRILFDDTKTATGVVVEMAGLEHTLAVDKEVILSAGALQSPQLLMVSGVGPARTLDSLDIPIVHDSPYVGQNLIDHVWFGAAYRVNVPTWTQWANDAFDMLRLYVDNYRQHRQGPLTANAGDFGAFEKVPSHLRAAFTAKTLQDLAEFPDDWPEVEVSTASPCVSRSHVHNHFPVHRLPHVPGRFQRPAGPPAERRLPVRVHHRGPRRPRLAGQRHHPVRRQPRSAGHQHQHAGLCHRPASRHRRL